MNQLDQPLSVNSTIKPKSLHSKKPYQDLTSMLTKLKNIFKLKRKPLSVKAEIRRDSNIDKYISAYGHLEDSPTSIGSGRTLEDALKDTAEKINSTEKQDITERQRILDSTEFVPLKINLYYNEIEETTF